VRRAIDVLRALYERLKALDPNSPIVQKLGTIIESIDRIKNDPNLTPEQKESKIDELLGEAEAAVKEYKAKRNGDVNQPDPQVTKLLEKALRLLGNRNQEEPATPVQNQPTQPPLSPVLESILRGQILNEEGNAADPAPHPLQLVLNIPVGRLQEAGSRPELSLEAFIRSLPHEIKIETSRTVIELLGRILATHILERLIKELVSRSVRSGELTRDALENAVKELNEQIARSVLEAKTKADPEMRRERDERIDRQDESKVTEKATKESPATTGTERITCQLVYDKKGNVVRIEISGKVKAVETARELVASRPAEILPIITEAALRLIEKNPGSQPEIVKFISEILAQPGAKPVAAPAAETAAKPIPVQSVNSPLSWATEPVLHEIIRSLITEPKAIVESHFDIARTILERSPEAALPMLLKEHAAAKEPAVRAALESLTLEVARSAEGQKCVLNAFAKGEEKPLISSEIGHKVIIQTVQNMIKAASPQPVAKAAEISLKGKDSTEQLVQISQLVATANKLKITPEGMKLSTAQSFLRLVAQTQRVIRLIGNKSLSRLEKRMNAKEKPAISSASSWNKAGRSTRRARVAQKSRTVNSRHALRELVQNAEESKLAIPKELFYIIGNHYAGLAGLTGIKDNRVMLPYEAAGKSEESTYASSLRRVLNVLEAELGRVTAGKTSQAAARISALSAEILVYGLIMRRVKAQIERADEIIKALKKKGYLSQMITAVKEGNFEGVIDFIDKFTLEAGLTPELQLAA
jgi:hypothetical protein